MDSISEVPLLSEAERLPKLHQFIYNGGDSGGQFKSPEARGLLQFVWAMALRSLSQLPGMTTAAAKLTEYDDSCLDQALENKAFKFTAKLIESKVAGYKYQNKPPVKFIVLSCITLFEM